MKAPLMILGTLVLGLGIFAATRGQLQAGLQSGGRSFVRFVPILALAFLIMGLVEVLVPAEAISHALGTDSGWRGLAIAWLAGVLTPAGSIMGMPIAAGLFQAGAGPAVLITYLTSLATLSVLRMPLEIGFYGWRLMSLRVAASVALPFVAGLTARLLGPLFLSRAG